MTKKERLFNEYANLVLESIEKYGETEFFAREKRDIQNRKFELLKFKIVDLEYMIDRVKFEINKIEKENKVKDFFNTAEGVKLKCELEQTKMQLTAAFTEKINSAEDELSKMVTEVCGESFSLTRFSRSYAEIEVVDKNGEAVFGHKFYISFDHYDGKYIEINYGSCGSFNPLTNHTRVIFLEGMTNFIKAENIARVNELFNKLEPELKKLSDEMKIINNKLENPFE